MLDIGIFEFLFIAVLGLLVAGPEKLPKYIAQGVKALRGLREMANKAKNEIVESAGLQDLDVTNLKNIKKNNLNLKMSSFNKKIQLNNSINNF